MVALKSFLVFLGLGAEAIAAATNPSLVCATDIGTETVKNVPTSTITSIKKVTIVKKVIRKINVYVVPVAKTTTIRTTTTQTSTFTADPETKTATSTRSFPPLVINEYQTVTVPTTTISTTTTTTFVTSTVAKPAGFTAVLEDPLYVAKRDIEKRANLQMLNTKTFSMYPQSVRCTKEVPTYSTKVTTTTVQGKRVTLKASTKTKMSTVATTVVTTEYPPDASTTVTTTTRPTVTTTLTRYTTTTLTQTVTVESQIPQATVYDSCSSDNILLTANGGGRVVAWVDVTSDTTPTIFDDGYTAADCCAECAKRPACRISVLGKLNGFDFTTATTCSIYLTMDTTKCANGAQPVFARYVTSNNSPSQPQYVYSNGPCGQLRNGGDLSDF